LNQPIPSGQNQKKVMVATPTNDILSIVFDSNMTVGTLKDRISAKIAVDSKNIMLHYHGYTMDNNSVLLTSYHVQENTTIQMSVRVNGGCLTKY
jgi:cephalosporin-C deacetylase-like acetyl esterase